MWIDEVNDYCTERTPVKILCGVRLDEEQNRMVSDTEAMMFAAKHKMLHCETSAKTGENVDFCFFQLAAKVCSYSSSALQSDPPIRALTNYLRQSFSP